jgi:hypothetical protein
MRRVQFPFFPHVQRNSQYGMRRFSVTPEWATISSRASS